VQVGIQGSQLAAIVSGLNPGDRVIQDPPDSLINNEKVTVESSQSSAFGAGGL